MDPISRPVVVLHCCSTKYKTSRQHHWIVVVVLDGERTNIWALSSPALRTSHVPTPNLSSLSHPLNSRIIHSHKTQRVLSHMACHTLCEAEADRCEAATFVPKKRTVVMLSFSDKTDIRGDLKERPLLYASINNEAARFR